MSAVPGVLAPARPAARPTGLARLERVDGLMAVLSLLAGIALIAHSTPVIIDDAYITFVYADHIAHGLGFVFSPGEHVLGTTTPLYALILALAMRLTGLPVVTLAIGVAAVSTGLCMAAGYLLARRFGTAVPLAVSFPVLLVMDQSLLTYALSGMETALFTALLLCCALAYALRRDVFCGVFLGLAVLTRPEALVLAAIVPLYAGLMDRRAAMRRAARCLAAAALVCLPWAVWATWYFGSPLPQSVIAKTGDLYNPIAPAHSHGVGAASTALDVSSTLLPWAVTVILVALASWLSPSFRHSGFTALALFGALIAIGHVVVSRTGHLIYPWYAAPFSCFPLLAGLALVGAVAARLRRWTRPIALAVLVGSAAAAFPLLGTDVNYGGRLAGQGALRGPKYQAICASLRPLIGPHTVVAASEIGYLGYYCHARILDTFGLVSPGVTRFYPLPVAETVPGVVYAIAPGIVRQYHPDYLVTLDAFARRSIMRDGYFLAHYRQIIMVPDRSFGSTGIFVFARRGLRVPVSRLAKGAPATL